MYSIAHKYPILLRNNILHRNTLESQTVDLNYRPLFIIRNFISARYLPCITASNSDWSFAWSIISLFSLMIFLALKGLATVVLPLSWSKAIYEYLYASFSNSRNIDGIQMKRFLFSSPSHQSWFEFVQFSKSIQSL